MRDSHFDEIFNKNTVQENTIDTRYMELIQAYGELSFKVNCSREELNFMQNQLEELHSQLIAHKQTQ